MAFLGINQFHRVGLRFVLVLYWELLKAQPKLVLMISQESNLRPLVYKAKKKTFCGFSMGRNQYWAGRVYDLCVYYMRQKKTFCGFSMDRNQYWARRVYDLCVYYMTGTPEGSTKSGFMEKPGIEPATPGLQGIALIHYTTGASL